MQISTFKNKIIEKIYSNKKDFVVRMKTESGLEVIGTIEHNLEDPIDFLEDKMIIALADNLKGIIPLGECEIVSDEGYEDTYVVKYKEIVFILGFNDDDDE